MTTAPRCPLCDEGSSDFGEMVCPESDRPFAISKRAAFHPLHWTLRAELKDVIAVSPYPLYICVSEEADPETGLFRTCPPGYIPEVLDRV